MRSDTIERVAIVGSGFMGHGIGQEFASGGLQVTLHDIDEERLVRAQLSIERNLQELVGMGVLAPEQVHPIMERIHTTDILEEAISEADLVVEAVFENLELKQKIFKTLDRFCPARTILATNTSTLKPSMLAEVTGRPERVLAMHFFYPVALMPLVELVPGHKTDEGIVQQVFDLLKTIGKSPIIVRKEALGFIANRLQFALQREALYIVEQGIATPQEVDIAVKDGFGRRLAVAGPFEIAEPIGWDLELQVQTYLFPDLASSPEPSPLVCQKVGLGELGVKTGQGFYAWTEQSAEAWRKKITAALGRLAGMADA
ncbi:MAG: 3-hydroxyacyl-CoA dehydrogenase family protein, partial [Anaerolineales bacterium]|nr:3-hydroxyacyl-CoA dehydrogenase family protein [Anaerolineales bacterium]